MSQFEVSFFTAGITIFLNYIIGKPGSEFSPYEIFSNYTVWLAKSRLKRLNIYEQYEKQFGLENAKYKHQEMALKNDAAIITYQAAESFFTWERALGMCVICTGFWISLLVGILFTRNFVLLGEVVVFSHIIIRILVKFL